MRKLAAIIAMLFIGTAGVALAAPANAADVACPPAGVTGAPGTIWSFIDGECTGVASGKTAPKKKAKTSQPKKASKPSTNSAVCKAPAGAKNVRITDGGRTITWDNPNGKGGGGCSTRQLAKTGPLPWQIPAGGVLLGLLGVGMVVAMVAAKPTLLAQE